MRGVVWLFRTVFTNQEQISMLQEDIRARDKRRDEDREILLELKADLKSEMKELRSDIADTQSEIMHLWKNK